MYSLKYTGIVAGLSLLIDSGSFAGELLEDSTTSLGCSPYHPLKSSLAGIITHHADRVYLNYSYRF